MNCSIIGQLCNTQIHPVTENWFHRVQSAQGGNLSYRSVKANNNFYVRCLGSGLSSSLMVINTFVSDNLTASLTPLLQSFGSSSWFNVNFTGSSDLTDNGLVGNGSNKRLRTGILPGQFVQTASAHISCYVSNDDSSSAQTEIGGTDAAGKNLRLYCHQNDTNKTSYFSCFTDSPGLTTPGFNGTFNGYYCGSRLLYGGNNYSSSVFKANSSTSHFLYASASAATGTPPIVVEQNMFCTQEIGAFANFSKKRLSFASWGVGLTITDSNNLFNAVQQCRKDLGGGWG